MPRIATFHGQPAYLLQCNGSRVLVGQQGSRLFEFSVNGIQVVHCDPNKMNRTTHLCGPCFGLPRDTEGAGGNLEKSGVYLLGQREFVLAQHGFLGPQIG